MKTKQKKNPKNKTNTKTKGFALEFVPEQMTVCACFVRHLKSLDIAGNVDIDFFFLSFNLTWNPHLRVGHLMETKLKLTTCCA